MYYEDLLLVLKQHSKNKISPKIYIGSCLTLMDSLKSFKDLFSINPQVWQFCYTSDI